MNDETPEEAFVVLPANTTTQINFRISGKRMNNNTRNILITIALAIFASHTVAESRYVADSLKLNLRTGATAQHKIIMQLRSGDKIELLATNDSGEYAYIRTSNNKEGWVLFGYLQKKPTAKVLLASSTQALKSTKTKLSATSATNQQLIDENKLLTGENETLTKENEKLSKEFSELQTLSGNAVNISRKNRELLEQNSLQQNTLAMQTAEVTRLQDQISSDQFYMGAGAIILGLIFGLIMPHLRPSQKDAGWA